MLLDHSAGILAAKEKESDKLNTRKSKSVLAVSFMVRSFVFYDIFRRQVNANENSNEAMSPFSNSDLERKKREPLLFTILAFFATQKQKEGTQILRSVSRN